MERQYTGFEVAIIGMSCRVSGASNWREYWEILREGKETLKALTTNDLIKLGADNRLINDKNFVKTISDIKRKDCFDSTFFDYTRDEAKLMDPQTRLFHECVWEALEDAAYNPEQIDDLVGLYSGASDNLNWRIYSDLMNQKAIIPDFILRHINNKDFMPSLVSYKLNLRGSSIGTQTACSSSLVAIHAACKALIFGEVKMAIAGGVSIGSSIQMGYFYEEGSILSKDGHCRTFDKDSSGTVGGEGLGAVVLKRLSDALNDGDHIYAIIKGSAANNDGRRKVGYTAPSVEGQVECIKMAQRFAKVEPSSIGYVEAHGTATKLGDSIEVEALNIAFDRNENKTCAIGSVKTNIGHLDAAAGVAGLIKTVISLKQKQIPASLNYNEPDTEVNFVNGPFYVNTDLQQWKANNNAPLRAAVNSFGVGGTNAHVILEEAPSQKQGDNGRDYKLLSLSAKTENSLNRYLGDLKEFLVNESEVNEADMCYTFHHGRKHFGYRKSFVFKDKSELIDLLDKELNQKNVAKVKSKDSVPIFMFSGQGTQYVNMGKELYENNRFFKDLMDKGFAFLKEYIGKDFKSVLFSNVNEDKTINQTLYTQPILFLFEYSLARLLMFYGQDPHCMIGHSIGEYVAACISGVFGFEDALKLVLKRAELMSSLQAGAMISVPISEDEAKQYLNNNVSLAAVNASSQIVLSGDTSSIERVMVLLTQMQIPFVKLHTSHAFHSVMQEPILNDFKKELEKIKFNNPKLPFISNLSGTLIRNEEATSPDYWVNHLRQTVHFSNGIKTLLAQNKDATFIEVGAGHALTSLLKQHLNDKKKPSIVNLIPSIKDSQNSECYFIDSIGKLWASGLKINWNHFYEGEKRKRVSLPTYSFEPLSYPTEVDSYGMIMQGSDSALLSKKPKVNDWFYRILWKPSIWLPVNKEKDLRGTTLMFIDNNGLGRELEQSMAEAGMKYIVVQQGNEYKKVNEFLYHINPKNDNDFEQLFKEIHFDNVTLSDIFHLWNYENDTLQKETGFYLTVGYESLLKLIKSYSSQFNGKEVRLNIVANNWFSVLSGDNVYPAKTTSLSIAKVIPLEFPNILCKAIDINDHSTEAAKSLWKELQYINTDEKEIAIRGNNRYVKDFEKIKFEMPNRGFEFKTRGTYLITGASGGMGKIFAKYLASEFKSNLVLISRGSFQSNFIDELKTFGSKVFCLQADISDKEKISKGVCDAEKEIGLINGVIHAAGLGDVAGLVIGRTKEDDDKIFTPKIYGTQVLKSIFQEKNLDFFVNCSSQNASLANVGQVAYVAANLYLDAFAESARFKYPVVSIEWDVLKDVGMARNVLGHLSQQEIENELTDFISSSEVINVLESALYLNIPTQIISTRDFKSLISYQEKIRNEILNQDFGNESVHKFERPDLSTNYLAPSTITEEKLKHLFEDLFGLQDIGIEDDFFELGGDSLKAMVIIRRIAKDLNEEISFKDFLDAKNIFGISKLIDEKIWINKTINTTNEIII